ncbi:MAG: Vi polysaccharide biosynthesis UDP-N-acetylglucosamine C-6 dehydrogenase TviB [Bacteroidia bacterium]|jgi:UDP-N-acetyl-D-galactosamine dehydrogenase|nr:Vi polysaccharide biosynthesis UDP-N-acetylglucosamine C-6 dehydrogenase TviB [Bacteroidia bacterium]
MKKEPKIAVIGLGYVGLPLAVEFGKQYHTVGFDINKQRIAELRNFFDRTLEVDEQGLKSAAHLEYANELESIKDCTFFVITVPTPVDKYNKPDLTPLVKASETVGKVLKKGDIVVYESTVYPGATEEECVPVLERVSGLKFNTDFYCGYSPERINPGDKEHTVAKILKVTSGSTPEVADKVDAVYRSIITAGTFKATSIKVAEAAKVIENSQRDINIAFVNELAKIFNLLNIDTNEVLEAAGTKWNFLKFKPGLVGGHCIGVDPYYLAQKAQEVGYHPEIILAGRRLNDSIGSYVADETIKLIVKKQIPVRDAKVLVMGITFKENCPDVRNTRVVDIIAALTNYHLDLTILDPWAEKESVHEEYGLHIINSLSESAHQQFDAIIMAVSHAEFSSVDIESLRKPVSVVFDVKGVLPKHLVDKRL